MTTDTMLANPQGQRANILRLAANVRIACPPEMRLRLLLRHRGN
jgi:hypothetical protein